MIPTTPIPRPAAVPPWATAVRVNGQYYWRCKDRDSGCGRWQIYDPSGQKCGAIFAVQQIAQRELTGERYTQLAWALTRAGLTADEQPAVTYRDDADAIRALLRKTQVVA